MTATTTTSAEPAERRVQLRTLGLYGLAAQDDDLLSEPWLEQVIDIEDRERRRRSLERPLDNARLDAFKPLADFDWQWPPAIERALIEELFSLTFFDDVTNVVLPGPNGVGKSMLAKNLTHQAVINGRTARFTTASDMLHDLAFQDSDASLARRLRCYTQPDLLTVAEVGYLAYDNRYAALLFEVVTRRYITRPIIVTTNKAFGEWNEVFPNAACVVTLVDRHVHRTELVAIDGDSYRLKEAKEHAATRASRTALEQGKAINDPYPPIVAVPDGLSDEAAAQLLEFLYDFARVFESHYAGQLHGYYRGHDERQLDLLARPAVLNPWSSA